MTIKQQGGVFGRNPTFNDVTIEGTLTFDGDIDITSDLTVEGTVTADGLTVDTTTLVVDAANNRVGIGTAIPASPLHIDYDGTAMRIVRGSAIGFLYNTGTAAGSDFRIQSNGGGLDFYYGSTGAVTFTDAGSERARIDSSGNVLVSDTAANPSGDNVDSGIALHSLGLVRASTNNAAAPLDLNVKGRVGDIATFKQDGTTVGSISVTASATAYNTSSDQRLKENIVDAPSASDDIDAIQVRSFDWKADGSHQKYGMIAQELQAVAPEAVSAPENPQEMMGVDYSKLVPMLIKEVQQLRARVAQLEGAN